MILASVALWVVSYVSLFVWILTPGRNLVDRCCRGNDCIILGLALPIMVRRLGLNLLDWLGGSHFVFGFLTTLFC